MRRFAAAGTRADFLRCARLLELAPDAASREKLLAGFEEAFKGRPLTGLPDELIAELGRAGGALSLVLRLKQGDAGAIADALRICADRNAPASSRRESIITTLGELRTPEALPVLLGLLDDAAVRPAVLAALAGFDDPAVSGKVLGMMSSWPVADRDAAFELLSSREGWAIDLLRSGAEIPAPVLDRLAVFKNAVLDAAITERRGKGKPTSGAGVEGELARVKGVLAAAEGVPKRGEATYSQRCATCHTLFGKGGRVGPDLTSYQRGDLDMLLLAVVAPGAEIREGFETTIIQTGDGAVFSGFVSDQDGKMVVLRDVAGQVRTIPRERITSQTPLAGSLMPPGLLDGLDDQATRDFFAYLRSTTPPF
jgi:putative heme-binding domain-containing protein